MKPLVLAGLLFLPLLSAAAEKPSSFKFDFGPGAAAPGYTRVTHEDRFTAERGYGFEPGATVIDADRDGDPLRGDFVTTQDPFFRFSVAVPEGNYRVTVTLGDPAEPSVTTVKAEVRRLMTEAVHLAAGASATRTFVVNVRTPKLSPGNVIKTDVREIDPRTGEPVTFTWDDKLTLEFCDSRPCVAAVEIERAPDATTVFLIGDSTVTDQASEPYGTWGQQLPRWFKPTVAVANHAESGQTLKAFRFQRRWDKVMSLMRPGDYVFLQFGHNDLNKSGHDAMWPRDDRAGDWINTYADPATDYIWLLAAYAVEVQRRGGIPVIVSPMTKINLKTGEVNTVGLGDYPTAARAAAELAHAAFIDLNAMSVEVMQALGPEQARKAYVDGLHSTTYGGYLFSRCIVEGIRHANLPLARDLADDAGTFDPSHPHPLPSEFTEPLEPKVAVPAPPGLPPRRK
jgi:lysophospholipase L1-like esterase